MNIVFSAHINIAFRFIYTILKLHGNAQIQKLIIISIVKDCISAPVTNRFSIPGLGVSSNAPAINNYFKHHAAND